MNRNASYRKTEKCRCDGAAAIKNRPKFPQAGGLLLSFFLFFVSGHFHSAAAAPFSTLRFASKQQ
jgi:hypothetical protein